MPGKVIEVQRSELGIVQGKVEFGGIVKQVNLSFTPDVEPGTYVVVHVGFSISEIDENEARRALDYLRQLDELDTSLGETVDPPADSA
jgi:hydrogenase expression/formation protein HypC